MTDFPLVNATVFAVLGIAIFAVALAILAKLAPVRVWDEIRSGNTAAAVIGGFIALGVAVIVAATMH